MILSWYRRNTIVFGFARATSLLLRVIWRRTFVLTCNALLPAQVECPCCRWSGNRFIDYMEMSYSIRNIECPQCGSHSRHRGFYLWLQDKYQLANKRGTALVFAPERALASVWTTASHLQIFGIDIEPTRDVDVLADVMTLPFASDVADLIWCHHVLEQVTDDHQAMKELSRVLGQRGTMILSAGMSGDLATREFGRSEKGLSGNRRSYGADIADRLRSAGFSVRQLSYGLDEQALGKYGIRDEPFYLCTKANQST
jgi:SAM-dependent methyltransferase